MVHQPWENATRRRTDSALVAASDHTTCKRSAAQLAATQLQRPGPTSGPRRLSAVALQEQVALLTRRPWVAASRMGSAKAPLRLLAARTRSEQRLSGVPRRGRML